MLPLRLLQCVVLIGIVQLCAAEFLCWYPDEPHSETPSCRGNARCQDFAHDTCQKGTKPDEDSDRNGSSFIIQCENTQFTMIFFKESWECGGEVAERQSLPTGECVAIGSGIENLNRLGFFVDCVNNIATCLSSYASTNKLDPTTQQTTSVQLQDLAVGDMVESYDIHTNTKVFTEVFLIQHQHRSAKAPVRRVVYETPDGQSAVHATETHYLFGPEGKVSVASLVPGSLISVMSSDGHLTSAKVLEVETVLEPIRNVHTMNDRLIVDGVLVSSFAELQFLGHNLGNMPELMAPLKLLHRLRLRPVVAKVDQWMAAVHQAVNVRKH